MDSRCAIALLCLTAAASLVWFERKNHHLGKTVSKLIASSAFLWLAWDCGALSSIYGQWVLLALALSWIGDVCLLSSRSNAFLTGIGAFLLAHVAFAIAFASRPLSLVTLAWALGVMAILGVIVLRWLWPNLQGFFRGAVLAYVAAIVAMSALSIVASLGGSHWAMALGALAFAVSDVSVARDRFVHEDIVNRIWGLPLYYVAQLLLAWSCISVIGNG
jgi:uncharacterized membrane protein YhhN